MEPREHIEQLEAKAAQPSGPGERFHGYGVMGLPFATGHILALRRFSASSIGPAYTSIWHRSPNGEWTFYSDVAPRLSCARYFGASAVAALQTPITISWTAARRLVIAAPAAKLEWSVAVDATLATRVLNQIAEWLPEAAWQNPRVLQILAVVAGRWLGLGHVGLVGTVPNGQRFLATPRRLWLVTESRAVQAGEDFGKPALLRPQARLGDFWIPQRGILALGQALFDVFDPQRHSSASCGPANASGQSG
jgi:hypothetical protein